jgi:hypothetical protein
MTDEPSVASVRVVSSADRLQPLADRHDVGPVVGDAGDDGALRIAESSAGDFGGSWERFFGRLHGTDQVVVYRPPESHSRQGPVFDVVSRASVGLDGGPPDPPDGDAETIATSDTGDVEPVAFGPGEEAQREEASANRAEAPVAPARDDERAPTAAAAGLVLDEIHGAQPGTGRGLDDEHLVFENDGEHRIDLSGWVVYNETGQSYQFADGTTLAPGDQVTLHSCAGSDTDEDRYWNADRPVWRDRRDTVTVETATGEDVLAVSYEV